MKLFLAVLILSVIVIYNLKENSHKKDCKLIYAKIPMLIFDCKPINLDNKKDVKQ